MRSNYGENTCGPGQNPGHLSKQCQVLHVVREVGVHFLTPTQVSCSMRLTRLPPPLAGGCPGNSAQMAGRPPGTWTRRCASVRTQPQPAAPHPPPLTLARDLGVTVTHADVDLRVGATAIRAE